jgi:hypothetical protein
MKALNHSQARALIEQAADGLLNAEEQRALESHLQGCADCRAYAAEFAALESALGATLLGRWEKPELSTASEQKLVHNLTEMFGKGGGSGNPPAKTGGRPFPRWWTVLVLAALAIAGGLATPGVINWLKPSERDENLFASSQLTLTETKTATATASPTETVTPSITMTTTPSPLILVAIPNRNANCRQGNGNSFEIADTLFEGVEYTPIARGRDNLWVQFMAPVNLIKCWAYIENIDLLINDVITPIEEVPESLLPFVPYPPTLTPTPTITQSPEPLDPSDTPPSSTLPQCNDGIDNDQDGAIDMRDKDCKDTIDSNEFD